MLTIIKQVKRIMYDDGRNDKSFYDEEYRLKTAMERVMETSGEVVKAAQRLSIILNTDRGIFH